MENAGFAGSLTEAEGTHFWKVDARLSPRGVRCKSTSPIVRQRRLELESSRPHSHRDRY